MCEHSCVIYLYLLRRYEQDIGANWQPSWKRMYFNYSGRKVRPQVALSGAEYEPRETPLCIIVRDVVYSWHAAQVHHPPCLILPHCHQYSTITGIACGNTNVGTTTLFRSANIRLRPIYFNEGTSGSMEITGPSPECSLFVETFTLPLLEEGNGIQRVVAHIGRTISHIPSLPGKDLPSLSSLRIDLVAEGKAIPVTGRGGP
jgi:hypothetical protein